MTLDATLVQASYCEPALRRELLHVNKHDKEVKGVGYTTWCEKLSGAEEQLGTDRVDLHSIQQQIVHLQGKKASLELQVEELRAEIALLQVKLR